MAAARPLLVTNSDITPATGLILVPQPGSLPAAWAGPVPACGLEPGEVAPLLAAVRPCALLPEHAAGWFGRPGLSGHRLGTGGGHPAAGRDWSPLLRPAGLEHGERWARAEAEDSTAGLRLVTEAEAVAGGAIRVRHTVVNTGHEPYQVNSLEVVFPLPGRVGEVLDFTGRQTAERIPQRHRLGDGLWLREGRRGHTGHDSATVVVAGVPGFGFGSGEVFGVHVAWSGNTVHRVERVPSGLGMIGGPPGAASPGPQQRLLPGVTTIGGGELLLPGEITLARGQSYTTPWVYLVASQDGLDGLSAQFHEYLRAQPAHPGPPRPVNLNVWEAVYFRHEFATLAALADRAASIGVERYVLDDGWFSGRRSDRAGLGDWQVDESVWPGGLHRLADYVRGLGMEFGLWMRGGAPAAHDQALAVYALLDRLRERFPAVEWESCAAGGGRVDLAMLERTECLWTSDMTDALARQPIQRWTGQLVPPEYLGAHVSAPFSHQTGRYMPLPLRCATALFGHLGIEWDITQADPGELADLADWIRLYKEQRALIHTGRVIRLDTPDDTAWMHGVVAADQSAALLSYVQLDQPRSDQPAALRVPGLDPDAGTGSAT